MRIACPYCGERESAEFSYLGDANAVRPDQEQSDRERCFYEAVYLRDNPAGLHCELWYHAYGCRRWLRVTRDTRTHVISDVVLAKSADSP